MRQIAYNNHVFAPLYIKENDETVFLVDGIPSKIKSLAKALRLSSKEVSKLLDIPSSLETDVAFVEGALIPELRFICLLGYAQTKK